MVGGDVHGSAAAAVRAVAEGGAGTGRKRSWWRSALVSAACGQGAVGGRVLPQEPHDAAARAAVRLFLGNRVPSHPAAEPSPCPRAGNTSRRRDTRLWIVDGTLIPVRDRSVGASSRNYRFSANVQVIIDADTRLVIAAARGPSRQQGRCPCVAGVRPRRAHRGCDSCSATARTSIRTLSFRTAKRGGTSSAQAA